LRCRQAVDVVERRTQELMQGCEWKLRFRFDSPRRKHVHVARAVTRVLEQRSLADPGLTPKDDRAAVQETGCLEQLS
jgi:hypothetical protein